MHKTGSLNRQAVIYSYPANKINILSVQLEE
jgi:hypothetical protein